METYLYFAENESADAASDCAVYPASTFTGIDPISATTTRISFKALAGTAAVTGAVTEDEDAFSLFFTPMRNTQGSSADDAEDDNPDVIVVAITTDNNAKVVMKAIVAAINGGPHSDGVIEIFDGVAGTKVHDDIEGLTILTNDND